jgi:hypothetical protein
MNTYEFWTRLGSKCVEVQAESFKEAEKKFAALKWHHRVFGWTDVFECTDGKTLVHIRYNE